VRGARSATLVLVAALLSGCVARAPGGNGAGGIEVELLRAPTRADPGPVDVEFDVLGPATGPAVLHWGPASDASEPYAYAGNLTLRPDGGLATLRLASGAWFYRIEVPTASGAFWTGEHRIDVRDVSGEVILRGAPQAAFVGVPWNVTVETRGVRGGTNVTAWIEWSVDDARGRGDGVEAVAPGPIMLSVRVPSPGDARWRVVVAMDGLELTSTEGTIRVTEGFRVVVVAVSDPAPGEGVRVTWRVEGPRAADVTTRLLWASGEGELDRATDPRAAEVDQDVNGVIPPARGSVIRFQAEAVVDGRTLLSKTHAVTFR